MWWPSYYPEWKRKAVEGVALRDHDQRLTYARAQGVAWLIDRCGGSGTISFAVGQRCVYRIGPAT